MPGRDLTDYRSRPVRESEGTTTYEGNEAKDQLANLVDEINSRWKTVKIDGPLQQYNHSPKEYLIIVSRRGDFSIAGGSAAHIRFRESQLRSMSVSRDKDGKSVYYGSMTVDLKLERGYICLRRWPWLSFPFFWRDMESVESETFDR
jgi:hypothetical protein